MEPVDKAVERIFYPERLAERFFPAGIVGGSSGYDSTVDADACQWAEGGAFTTEVHTEFHIV